ncbi:MAG: PP2C family protein-serine/threonine phosphatase [Candidatus Rokubacteria bacterium]|nr:PP2C family protein-serine/threonine phosphatase [Candidatus Rokubacteria bacterium]
MDVEYLRSLLAPLAAALRARCLVLTPEGRAVVATQPPVNACPARLDSPRAAICGSRECPFRGAPYFAPIEDEGELRGHLFWCMGGHPTDRRAFASGLADLVAASERHAGPATVATAGGRRIEVTELQHELEIARKMQESLLPAGIPDVEGLEIAASLKPTSNVGGDYYDVLPLGGGYVGLVIADVSGHGVSSGMMMTSFRMALLTELSREFSPSAVFRRINNLLHRDCDRLRMFVSAVLAVYEPLTGNLQYANAGHNPPRMRKAGRREVMRLPATGVPLGMLEDMAYDEASVILETGDALLLYTDGLVENRSAAGVTLGEAGLDRIMAIAENKGATELLNFVLTLSDRQLAGAEPRDDVTVVVATRTW